MTRSQLRVGPRVVVGRGVGGHSRSRRARSRSSAAPSRLYAVAVSREEALQGRDLLSDALLEARGSAVRPEARARRSPICLTDARTSVAMRARSVASCQTPQARRPRSTATTLPALAACARARRLDASVGVEDEVRARGGRGTDGAAAPLLPLLLRLLGARASRRDRELVRLARRARVLVLRTPASRSLLQSMQEGSRFIQSAASQ